MIMNVDTVRDIIMETKNRNFSSIEYDGEQVLYCLRVDPIGKEYSLFPIFSMEYTTQSDVKKLQAIAKIINDGHGFRADVLYRKIGIYTCKESKGSWQRYEE